MPLWMCLCRHQRRNRPRISRAAQLTGRSVLLERGVRRARRRRAIDIHGLQPPPFAVLLFPFTLLSEHGLQVFRSSILILRVIRVLERFRDVEI